MLDLLPKPGRPRERRDEIQIDGAWYRRAFYQRDEQSLGEFVAQRRIGDQNQIFLRGQWVQAKEWMVPAFSNPAEFQALRCWLPLEPCAVSGTLERLAELIRDARS